jgi:oxygen-independent coproporphyrinogen-3 oxidase
MYTIEMLWQNGYQQYEISNFSIPGYESKHNLRYWQMKDYMGFGPSAASCVGNIRYSYIKDLKAYLSGIAGSKSIVEEYEEISPMEKASEYIMLGLRTTHGIKKSEYSSIYLSEWEPIENLLKEFESKGWAACEDERWSLTPSGFLISNQLIGAVLDAQAAERAQTSPWMRDTLKDVEPVVLPASDEEQFSAYIEELLR